MSLDLVLTLTCVVMLPVGILVMRVVFAQRTSQRRGISLAQALVGTQWLRNDRGRVRRVVVAWVALWVLLFFAAGALRR